MGDQPGADELLTVARETLKQVLDELPPEHRYPVLMVLNAMAIAARDGRTPGDAEAQPQLRELCGDTGSVSWETLLERLATGAGPRVHHATAARG